MSKNVAFLTDGSLTKKDIEKAERELFENPSTRDAAIKRLRAAVLGYPGLTCPTDDRFLLRFLRGRKFDEDQALRLIVQYYRVRNEYPELFGGAFLPSAVKEIVQTCSYNPLPLKDKDGRLIVWYRVGEYEQSKLDTFVTHNTMTNIILSERDDVQVNGLAFIVDFEDFGIAKAIQISTPSNNKRSIRLVQDSMPLRLKGIHYINEPLVISYIWPIAKQFMKQKLVERVHFHAHDRKSLHEHFSPDILPEELGGTIKNYFTEIRPKWVEKVLSYEDKFAAEASYGLIEDTPGMKGEDFKQDALQGMSGSFRRLNVD